MVSSQIITKDIDRIFSQTFSPNQAGGALLIVKNDKKVFEKAIGISDEKMHTPHKIEPGFGLAMAIYEGIITPPQ